MKRALMFAFVLLLVVAPLTFAKSVKYMPEAFQKQVQEFPDYGRPLTVAQMANHGLRVERLKEPVVVLNYYRSLRDGRPVLDKLEAGTMVLRAPDGRLVYNQECGNPIYVQPSCPDCPVAGALAPSTLEDPLKGANELEPLWRWLGYFVKLMFLISLAGLLLLLLAALIWGFRAISKWVKRRRQPAPVPAVTPVAPVPGPTPVMVPPPVPLPPPAPARGILVPAGTLYIPGAMTMEVRDGRITIHTGNGTIRFEPAPARVRRVRTVPKTTPVQ